MRRWAPLLIALAFACKQREEAPAKKVEKSSASERATRRLFDGAPPVIPHGQLGAKCTGCHNERGLEVPELGYAPPSPHEKTDGLSDRSRCRQCHVFRAADGVFRKSNFAGLEQNLRKGERLYAGAPPVIPHDTLMRENCAACHDGPAAREPIRTSHPERARCRQCHVERDRDVTAFVRPNTQP